MLFNIDRERLYIGQNISKEDSKNKYMYTIYEEKIRSINEHIKFDVLSKMKDFETWIMTNQIQDKKNICTYVNIWIPKGTIINSRTINIVNKLVNLVKTNDILGFKKAYQKLTNYNFENAAIKYDIKNYCNIFGVGNQRIIFPTSKMIFLIKQLYLQGESFEAFLKLEGEANVLQE